MPFVEKLSEKERDYSRAGVCHPSGPAVGPEQHLAGYESPVQSAGVKPDKVFPHNLRHLFARTFYTQEKDLSRLADILGHTSVNTTRIYTAESGLIHARQMERMGLIVT